MISNGHHPEDSFETFTRAVISSGHLALDGRTVENKGKLILTEIFPSVQNMIFKSIDVYLCVYVFIKDHLCVLIQIKNYTYVFYFTAPSIHSTYLSLHCKQLFATQFLVPLPSFIPFDNSFRGAVIFMTVSVIE